MSSEEATRTTREAAEETALLERVEAGVGELGAVELRRVLNSPFLTEGVIRALLADPKALELREVRLAIAAHPATPQAEAMRMLVTLSWKDLVGIGRDVRARPPVRRAAERVLLERYESYAAGVRAAIARSAGAELLSRVRHDPDPRVIGAMLENPRLTEGLLLPMLAGGRTSPEVLALVARTERWVSRYQVRRAVCRNRRAPLEVTLPLLPRLKKGDLAAIGNDPASPPEVRRRALLLYDGGASERGKGRGLR